MNTSPWDTSGPSMLGTQFYTPGWSPPKPRAPKPLTTQKRDIDIDALKAYRATHSVSETAAHFGCSTRHLNRRFRDAMQPPQIDRMEVHAYRMSGKSLRACATKFHIGRRKVAALLDGLPQLVAPERKPKAPGKRLEKFGASYTFCITPKMRAMVVQMGGAGYLRSLIDKEVHAL